jgi:hypothetical protein
MHKEGLMAAKDEAESQSVKQQKKIRWAARLRPALLKRLYESDARGFQDMELCDEVGVSLYVRCETFHRVRRGEVVCPECGTVFVVARRGVTTCPVKSCGWRTTFEVYGQSVRNHYAWPGRATDSFEAFYRCFPTARTYRDKILLIDKLIHSFHMDEKTHRPVKSVASKLLEGNKRAVVQFLDELSGIDANGKAVWRQTTASTIDVRAIQTKP